MSKKGPSHFGEGTFDQIEPRAMFGRMSIFKASRAGGQVSHRFLGNMGGVVIQYDADECVAGVMGVP